MLVQACLSGDNAAFGNLVDQYEGKLFNVALQITGSREDAMDATQAAFVKAYEKLHTFDPSYRFFSWIYRIAINESLNHVKRRGREATLETETAATMADPEREVGDSETWNEVVRAMRELKPEHRAVVVLRHLEGLSYREIADILSIPENKVKSRLFSARRRLRHALLERGVAKC
jgi:RNA polymerase sigma-70 factor (ECF subfamily)